MTSVAPHRATSSRAALQAGRGPVARSGPLAPAGRRPRSAVDLLPYASAAAVLLFSAVAGRPHTAAILVVGLCASAVAACLLTPAAADRRVLALSALVTLQIALPIARIPHDRRLVVSVVAACGALAVAGLAGSDPPARPRGQSVVLALFGAMTLVTLLSPDDGAVQTWLVTACAALPAFLLAVRCGGPEIARITPALAGLAVSESLLAVAEPFLFPAHLWATAQVDETGQRVALANAVLGHGLERSQGTLGHPLPLGLLLVVSLALTLRLGVTTRLRLVLFSAVTILGLAFAGARSALGLAVLVIVLASARRPSFLQVAAGLWALATGALCAIALGLVSSEAVSTLTATGSYTHRVAAYGAFRTLLDQPTPQVLAGNGFASTPRMFDAGLLQNDGFNAVDNQFVLILGQGGVVCLVLLAALLLLAAVRGRPGTGPSVWCVLATLLVFDVLTWPSAAAVCLMVLGLALSGPFPHRR